MNEGWACPKCGKVMAPWMPTCTESHAPPPIYSTGTQYPPFVPVREPLTGDPLPPQPMSIY
jgi:hypothetical protein